MFGIDPESIDVIGEDLLPMASADVETDTMNLKKAIDEINQSKGIHIDTWDSLANNSLAKWIEQTLGVDENGVRQDPRPLKKPWSQTFVQDVEEALSTSLVQASGCSELEAEQSITIILDRGSKVKNDIGRPFFTFRIHQILNKGDTVHVTAELPSVRKIHQHAQVFAPNTERHRLYPLVFCRECGQEYLLVRRRDGVFEARHWSEHDDAGGYLYISEDSPWPVDSTQQLERLPEDYLREGKLRRERRDWIPLRWVLSRMVQSLLHQQQFPVRSLKENSDFAFPVKLRMMAECRISTN